jgi:hypothetical protein
MAENVIKKQAPQKPARKEKGQVASFLSSMLDGTILTKEKVESMLPFFLFLASLAIVLIFNTYYAEKKAREVERLRTDIIELRLRYITTKSELMVLSNQTEVARRLKSRGIEESMVPPRQLTLPKKERRFLPGIIGR